MPANLTYEQAAAVPVSAVTALQALRDRGRLQPGQRVLVIGASGGVGTFAVQIAKALGAHVTGVASTQKVDMVRSLGADHVIDYTQADITDGDERYDLVLDIGGNRAVSALRRVLTADGTLVFVGGEDGGRWTGGIHRQLGAMIVSLFVRQRLVTFITKPNTDDLDTLRGLIEAGSLTPAVDRVIALEQVPDAIRDLAGGRVRGKVVIATWSKSAIASGVTLRRWGDVRLLPHRVHRLRGDDRARGGAAADQTVARTAGGDVVNRCPLAGGAGTGSGNGARGGTGKPRMRIRVAPRRLRAGRRTRIRFRVTSRGRPVRGAKVRFAGRTKRTGRRGRAVMVRRFARPGRRRTPSRASAGSGARTCGYASSGGGAHIGIVRADVWPAAIFARSEQEPSWESLDVVRRSARTHRLDVLGLLDGTPHWLAACPQPSESTCFNCPPADLAAWERMVEQIVARAPEIRYWEVINEADHPDRPSRGVPGRPYATSPASHERGAVRRGNPRAKVVFTGGCCTTGMDSRRCSRTARWAPSTSRTPTSAEDSTSSTT